VGRLGLPALRGRRADRRLPGRGGLGARPGRAVSGNHLVPVVPPRRQRSGRPGEPGLARGDGRVCARGPRRRCRLVDGVARDVGVRGRPGDADCLAPTRDAGGRDAGGGRGGDRRRLSPTAGAQGDGPGRADPFGRLDLAEETEAQRDGEDNPSGGDSARHRIRNPSTHRQSACRRPMRSRNPTPGSWSGSPRHRTP